MVYPLRIIKPLKKNTVDNAAQLNMVVSDILANGCKISQFIGDNPKRSGAKECLCFSSWFPCEYCFSKGTKLVSNNSEIEKKKKQIETQKQLIQDRMEQMKSSSNVDVQEMAKLKKIEKDLNETLKKLKPIRSNIVWPKTSANGPPRTGEEIFEIIEKIENNQPMTIDEAKGITGRSILFDIPGFDFVMDTPVDYLHCTCLGVVKRCLELTFKLGENRKRTTKRPLSSPALFNALIKHIKVVHEFSRRLRDLDLAVYKGQEFRNVLLFLFPLVLDCIPEGAKERQMWLLLSFMIKSCAVPTEEFRGISEVAMENAPLQFYSVYERLFGTHNCTYNTHVSCSHLMEMRYHGPLTEVSAFPFESFYGELRNSFVPGTVSTIKQMFSNILLKRSLSSHICEKSIYISVKDTPLECNSLLYSFRHNEYNIFKVVKINDDTFTCKKVLYTNCSFPETPTLDWNTVGVFKLDEISEQEQTIPHHSVKGKVLLVKDYLITCPTNVLIEK